MTYKILYNLWKAKRSASPSSQFKQELWNRLEQNLSAEPVFLYQQVWFKWSLVGVASLLVVASFGTGVYAYNSPEITENNPLYAVKQIIEKVEEVAKITPEAKARFLIKKISRREAEKKIMERRGQALERIEQKIEKTTEQLENLRRSDVGQKRIRERQDKLEDKKETLRRSDVGQEQESENKINKKIVPSRVEKRDEKNWND